MTYKECRLELERILGVEVVAEQTDSRIIFSTYECGNFASVSTMSKYIVSTDYTSFRYNLNVNIRKEILDVFYDLANTDLEDRDLPKDRVEKQEYDRLTDKNIDNKLKTPFESFNRIDKIEDGWLVITRNKDSYIKIKDILIDKDNGFMPCSDYKYLNGIFSVESIPLSMRKFDKEFDILEIWKPKYEHLSLSYNLEDRDLVWCNKL